MRQTDGVGVDGGVGGRGERFGFIAFKSFIPNLRVGAPFSTHCPTGEQGVGRGGGWDAVRCGGKGCGMTPCLSAQWSKAEYGRPMVTKPEGRLLYLPRSPCGAEAGRERQRAGK